jgi:hypothetical protein
VQFFCVSFERESSRERVMERTKRERCMVRYCPMLPAWLDPISHWEVAVCLPQAWALQGLRY